MSGRHFVALDLDGTLEDSRADMVASVARVRAHFGLSTRAEDEVRPWVSRGMHNLYTQCFDDHLSGGATLADVREAYLADYMAHIADTTVLYEGIADALGALAQIAVLACVTAKPEAHSRALLEVLGVGHLFTAIVGGDSTPESKPHPLLLEAAARQCAYSPVSGGRAFMIGDSAGDVKLGRAYGAVTIWCAWGYKESPDPETPHLHASSPSDLPALVAPGAGSG